MARHKVEICGVNTADLKVLKNEEMILLFKKYHSGDMQAKEQLVNGNLKLVLSILRKYNNRCDNMDDLFQIGCIGLIKAIKRFDINLDVQLSTYAVPYIMGEIKRFIRDDGLIKVSRQTKELSIKIKQIQNEYLNKNGEEISISKIAKMLDISKEDVASAIESNNTVNSIYSVEGGNEDEKMLIEKIGDNKDEYNCLINKITIQELIGNLDEREKKVILLRYYKEQTQAQVGKTLGITQVQVSRIEKKVLDKMKLKLEAV